MEGTCAVCLEPIAYSPRRLELGLVGWFHTAFSLVAWALDPHPATPA